MRPERQEDLVYESKVLLPYVISLQSSQNLMEGKVQGRTSLENQ